MPRIKKVPNTYWSKEEKYKIVLKVVNNFRSTVDVAREYDISQSMLSKCLQNMINDKIKRGYKGQETIFHSDQGTIYSSVAFNNAHK